MFDDNDIESILIASGEACKHRKRPLDESDYSRNIRRKANKTLEDWCFNGVPSENWDEIKNCSTLVERFGLNERDELRCHNKEKTQKVDIK